MTETSMIAGGHEYDAQPPVMPTHVCGPISEYAGSRRLIHVSKGIGLVGVDLDLHVLYEGCSYYNTRTEVSCKQVYI